MPGIKYKLINKRGVFFVFDEDTKQERPATSMEVELWNYFVSQFKPTRESFVRIAEEDLQALLVELTMLRSQLKDKEKEVGAQQG